MSYLHIIRTKCKQTPRLQDGGREGLQTQGVTDLRKNGAEDASAGLVDEDEDENVLVRPGATLRLWTTCRVLRHHNRGDTRAGGTAQIQCVKDSELRDSLSFATRSHRDV